MDPSRIRVLVIDDGARDREAIGELASASRETCFPVEAVDRLSAGAERRGHGPSYVRGTPLWLPDSPSRATVQRLNEPTEDPYQAPSPESVDPATYDWRLCKRVLFALGVLAIAISFCVTLTAWRSYRLIGAAKGLTAAEQIEEFFAGWNSVKRTGW